MHLSNITLFLTSMLTSRKSTCTSTTKTRSCLIPVGLWQCLSANNQHELPCVEAATIFHKAENCRRFNAVKGMFLIDDVGLSWNVSNNSSSRCT